MNATRKAIPQAVGLLLRGAPATMPGQALLAIVLATAALFVPVYGAAQDLNLPSGKELIGEAPGHPQRTNSLPLSMAISPDGRYVVTVNAGYGTYESQYAQSLAVLNAQTGVLLDFPDHRTLARVARQTLYSGLAFSRDGKHVYASMASLTDPEARHDNDTGSGIVVYDFADGKIGPEHFLHLPLQQLAPGRTTRLPNGKESSRGVPYPAAIAVTDVGGAEKLLVADNLSDDVLLLDVASGAIEKRFDLSESNAVPSTYPVALAVSKDSKRAFVALWNASQIVELNLSARTVGRKLDLLKPRDPVAPGTHPCAFALSPDGRTLYAALANRDAIAAVNVGGGQFRIRGYFDTRLPGQSYFGAEPVAVATNADGSRLYAANMGTDAVAVFDARRLTAKAAKAGMVAPIGFVPTEWMPISMAFLPSAEGGRLFVATDKGRGTGPDDFPQRRIEDPSFNDYWKKKGHYLKGTDRTYIGTLLYGSLAGIGAREMEKNLPQWTEVVLESNRMKAAAERISFAGGARNPIRHVIYIIKENRTYDQVLGDLQQAGKPVGNGDPSLTMYGAGITPNVHKLALQFGVLDNFYVSGEVSENGHVWSTAAITSDYIEKIWQQRYRGRERPTDGEGVVANGYPLLEKIPDVTEPGSGYLWSDLAEHGKTYYHFGEYISSTFCDQKAIDDPSLWPLRQGPKCARKAIAPGERLPAEWGGGVSKWPWPIPILAANVATKPELLGHFAAEAPDWNLMVPDQIRTSVFLRHLNAWIADKQQGKDTMPQFILLRLPNDHTMGTVTGGPTPKASVADNDLAVGRAVDAISHSSFWDDTAFFILEDDAGSGDDHVDAHRSYALVISKYAPHGRSGRAFVDSHFYTTVSMIRTMEVLLGLPPMNNDDAFCAIMSSLFAGPGDQPAYTADYSNEKNNLIYTLNKKNAVGARESRKMDFSHADRANPQKLNVILWKDAMGDRPVPAALRRQANGKAAQDDGD